MPCITPSVEQILAEGFDPAYIVFAMPEWAHFHPTDLPTPIADWIARNCPEVEINWIESFPSLGTYLDLDRLQDDISAALGVAPVFQIGFTTEQAEAFVAAWRQPDGSASNEPEFYLCDVSRDNDQGAIQYDVHGRYCVPPYAMISDSDGDHPT